MNEPIPPMLVIASFEMVQDGGSAVTIKGFASSLLRSLFSGRIAVFRNHPMPLFKVERRALDDVCVPITLASKSDSAKRQVTREFLFGLCNSVKPEPRQWVIVADAGSLALRNIDHLIPPDLAGPYGPTEVDFYWAEGGKRKAAGGKLDEASPGLWAVRGEHLPMVLERWRDAWNAEQRGVSLSDGEIWTGVVRDLPLRKKRFEKGEVVSPDMYAMDWQALSSAAFVTVPDWPRDEQWKFLQALYFGTYFGDETGMMLNVLEA